MKKKGNVKRKIIYQKNVNSEHKLHVNMTKINKDVFLAYSMRSVPNECVLSRLPLSLIGSAWKLVSKISLH